MSIIGLDSVASRGGQTQSSQNSVMGKDDFLHLLVAQLQAQDPMNPMDSTGFTAQLAQFSSLEQLQNINSSLNGIGTSQAILKNSQAVSFIGKQITAVGNSVAVTDGNSGDFLINLDQDAAEVYIKVYDEEGNFVRDIDAGELPAGRNAISWDGMDHLDGRVPDGVYYFEAMAVDADGQSINTVTFTSGIVTGVNYRDGIAYLVLNDQEVPMGNVFEVSEPRDEGAVFEPFFSRHNDR